MRLALKPLGAKLARTLPSWVGGVAPNEARGRVTPVRNGGHENVQTPEKRLWRFLGRPAARPCAESVLNLEKGQ